MRIEAKSLNARSLARDIIDSLRDGRFGERDRHILLRKMSQSPAVLDRALYAC
jgi:hypothetical protein